MNQLKRAFVLVASGLGLWVLLASPASLLGVSLGNAATLALMATVWTGLYVAYRQRRSAAAVHVAKTDYVRTAHVVAFVLIGVIYVAANADQLLKPTALASPEARAIGRNLVLLAVAWAISSYVGRPQAEAAPG